MRLLKSTFLIIFLGILSKTNYSQVYGYMGQRFSTELNLGMSFSRAYDKSNFSYAPGKNFSFSFHPEINLNYTIGKRVDMGIDVGFQKFESNVVNQNNFSVVNNAQLYRPDLTPFANSGNSLYFYPAQVSNSTYAFNFDFYFRFYTRRHIAPVGVYHQFGFGVTKFGFKDKDIEGYFSYSRPSSDGYSEPFINTLSQTEDLFVKQISDQVIPRFSYRLGKKIVAKSGLYLNLSAEINITIKRSISSKGMSKKHRNYQEEQYRYNYIDTYNNSAYISASQFFELKIGVGKTF